MWQIIIWLAVFYIVGVVLWRLFIAIIMISSGYSEKGWMGAVGAAALNFFVNLWDLGKFAFTLLIITLIFRGCSK